MMTSTGQTRQRIAVVLFNLGGPDRPEAVRPFLFNLFNDPAIISLPGGLRTLVAYLIARRRAKPAGEIYAQIGGRSPLLENTQAQADALAAALNGQSDDGVSNRPDFRVFIAMRYWHPMSEETAQAVKDFDPAQVILLPLYPQYSRTTTGSSMKAWHAAAKLAGLNVPHRLVTCYPDDVGFIAAVAESTRTAWAVAKAHGKPRVLFSAHGLPKKIIAAGDPYQWQCEQTALAIVAELGIDDLDWVNCYQSRVGPLEWIGPSTDAELQRAADDKVPVVIVPIAFVSEHSETLVEIDIEYREMAHRLGIPHFGRVATVGVQPAFIDGLARLVRKTLDGEQPARAPTGTEPKSSAKAAGCGSTNCCSH
jgi:ferrochelatase